MGSYADVRSCPHSPAASRSRESTQAVGGTVQLQSSIRVTTGRAGRLLPLAAALLLAALTAATSSSTLLAQEDGPGLVNHDRDFVERKKNGNFVARPVFDRQVSLIHYGIRHPETGEWLSAMYRVQSNGKGLDDGWEYTWEYPAVEEQPDLPREEAFLLVMAVSDGGDTRTFHAVIPIYRSSSLWDRVLQALDPGRWARAFAGWVVDGVYRALCGVVERASGAEACEG